MTLGLVEYQKSKIKQAVKHSNKDASNELVGLKIHFSGKDKTHVENSIQELLNAIPDKTVKCSISANTQNKEVKAFIVKKKSENSAVGMVDNDILEKIADNLMESDLTISAFHKLYATG